jgi:hypothetical protein
MATDLVDHSVHTWRDVLDLLGWGPYGDIPQFAFNPLTTTVFLVALAKLLNHDAVMAVKLTIVFQFWLAAASMAALYAVHAQRWSIWAALAGLLYAFLPATSLTITGNLDFGFCVALAPFAIAFGLFSTKRWGLPSLVAAGAICGFIGQGFAAEYFLIASVPIYAVVVANAFEREKKVQWATFSLLGAAASLLVGSYTILASLSSTAVFSSPATRVSEVTNGTIVGMFSETLSSLLHFVLTESTLSPQPEFNVSDGLWTTSIAAMFLWILAFRYFYKRVWPDSRYRAQGVLTVCLLLLSLGTTVPFVATLWIVFGKIPFAQLLRTPDRLVLVPFVFVVLWAIAGVEEATTDGLRNSPKTATRSAFLLGLTLAFASFFYFDFSQGSLLTRNDASYRLPRLSAVNMKVAAIGSPYAPYSFVNEGSVSSTPLYGLGSDTRFVTWDLLGRYAEGDGHALGLLRKAGIKSIITTPRWAYDDAAFPDYGAILASDPGVVAALGSSRGPAVWRVKDPIERISRTTTVCFFGGPGLYDVLSRDAELRNEAFIEPSAGCNAQVLGDYDPRDMLQNTMQIWRAADLPHLGPPIRDYDYRFVSGRNLLAVNSYRNSIDGDSPVFGPSVFSVPPGWSTEITLRAGDRTAFRLAFRLAAHVPVCIGITIDRSPEMKRCVGAGFGLHWIEVPIRPISTSPGEISLRRIEKPLPLHPTDTDVALDGIALLPQIDSRLEVHEPSVVAFAGGWMTDSNGPRHLWLPAGRFEVHSYDQSGRPTRRALTIDGKKASGAAIVDLKSPGYHRIAAGYPSVLTIFKDLRFTPDVSGTIAWNSLSATSWRVSTKTKETVRLAFLNDGNWRLRDLRNAGKNADQGISCDLVDTCFEASAPGSYVLEHTMPRLILVGLILTTVAWVAAWLFLALGVSRRSAPLRS